MSGEDDALWNQDPEKTQIRKTLDEISREARTSSRGERNTQKGMGGIRMNRRVGSWRFWDG